MEQEQLNRFKKAALVFRAFNHKKRQLILDFIHDEFKNVTTIYETLDIEQSVASQQMAILKKAGLVKSERKGKEVFYQTNTDNIKVIDDFCKIIITD